MEAAEGGPLAGLRIIEAGSLIAGPFCGQLLGDLGAEVLKIEPPGSGDPLRGWGRVLPEGRGLWWAVMGRNKKSVTLDLREAEGQELMRALIGHADVLIENFRPGTLEGWGLDPDALRRAHPSLIVARVSGYGQTGPYADRAGYGAIGEAMGGLRYTTGDPDRPPSRIGISVGDGLAATYTALGVLAALHHRDRTGQGQQIDTAIYEAVLTMMESVIPEYDRLGYVRERSGAVLPGIAPSNAYPTADGSHLLIAANQDTVFTRLAAVMGQPGLATDPRYRSHEARARHQEQLDALIADWTRGQDAVALEALLSGAGVPAGRIYRPPDMLSDPHYAAREAIVHVEHPRWGRLAMAGVVLRLSDTPGTIRTPAPELGEHTDEVLGGLLGLSPARIAALRGAGIV